MQFSVAGQARSGGSGPKLVRGLLLAALVVWTVLAGL